MERDYLAFFPIIVLLAVALVLARLFYRKDRQHASETGKTPLFTENCAGAVGWLTYKGPFIRVAVYSDFIIVSCNKPYYLPFRSITQIEKRSFLFRKGYRIHHRNPDYPRRIELWLGSREQFETAIQGKVNLI